jgi:EmrB/QacA subfamily drug resistance transporter
MTPSASEQVPSRWLVLGVVAVGVFMATLDSSIVNISLPAIARHFGVPLGAYVEWVVIAYLVVIAALLLTVGRLADLYGHKPLWAIGLAVFTVGSALCGAATSLSMLVAFRVLLGIGGALLMAIAPAMLTAAFPPAERGRAIGLNAVTVSLGISAGPTLGGVLTEHLSWRSIFYVNVPIGILGFALTVISLPRSAAQRSVEFDPIGALLLGIGLASTTAYLSVGQEIGWLRSVAAVIGALACLALVGFVWWERRHPHPVVDMKLFRGRVFASATVSLVLSFLALFAVGFMMPFYLEQLRHFSTEQSGLLLTPMPATIAVVAPISGALSDRYGTTWFSATGLGIACAGLVLLAHLDAASSPLHIGACLAVTGLGQGLFQSPNNSALLGAAPPGRQGVASGMLATARVVGQSLSVAVAGAVFTALGGAAAANAMADRSRETGTAMAAAAAASPTAAEDAAGAGDDVRKGPELAFVRSFRITFYVCAGISALGIATSLVRGRSRSNGSRLA